MLAAKAILLERKGKEVYYTLSWEDYSFWKFVLERYHRDKVIVTHDSISTLFKLLLENKEILKECQHLFLFGSFVEGKINTESDIDLLFVARHKDKIIKWCREVSIIVQRDINPVIYTPVAYKRDLNKKEAFLNSVVMNIKNRVILK
ncbi:MAG TPA: nucleotidyltransferase domain-containing protein [Candidatus Nanoarchaeia archaeon]|nr:nucleotidyltransferase domain-containing protein [Candidatus Nanoarchaeia archaeon]